MPFSIVRADLTAFPADAIVCPTDSWLSGSGGTDAAIRQAAGPRLERACRALAPCEEGGAVLTRGYRLPCRWIIHTPVPRWEGGGAGEAARLAGCYRSALELAEKKRVEHLAIPVLGAGSMGFPGDLALEIANSVLRPFSLTHETRITLVVYSREIYRLSLGRFEEIQSLITDAELGPARENSACLYSAAPGPMPLWDSREETASLSGAAPPPHSRPAQPRPAPSASFGAPMAAPSMPAPAKAGRQPVLPRKKAPADAAVPPSLEQALRQLDESFSQALLRMIDQAGMKDSECYKKANVDRKLFSKIRSNPAYRPSKPTAVAFAIALELDLDQTGQLLAKAGYALSHSSAFDVIIEYFIRQGNYDIFQINEALFAFDQVLLGA